MVLLQKKKERGEKQSLEDSETKRKVSKQNLTGQRTHL